MSGYNAGAMNGGEQIAAASALFADRDPRESAPVIAFASTTKQPDTALRQLGIIHQEGKIGTSALERLRDLTHYVEYDAAFRCWRVKATQQPVDSLPFINSKTTAQAVAVLEASQKDAMGPVATETSTDFSSQCVPVNPLVQKLRNVVQSSLIVVIGDVAASTSAFQSKASEPSKATSTRGISEVTDASERSEVQMRFSQYCSRSIVDAAKRTGSLLLIAPGDGRIARDVGEGLEPMRWTRTDYLTPHDLSAMGITPYRGAEESSKFINTLEKRLSHHMVVFRSSRLRGREASNLPLSWHCAGFNGDEKGVCRDCLHTEHQHHPVWWRRLVSSMLGEDAFKTMEEHQHLRLDPTPREVFDVVLKTIEVLQKGVRKSTTTSTLGKGTTSAAATEAEESRSEHNVVVRPPERQAMPVVVVVFGGEARSTRRFVVTCLARGYQVLVVEGSGGFADEVCATRRRIAAMTEDEETAPDDAEPETRGSRANDAPQQHVSAEAQDMIPQCSSALDPLTAIAVKSVEQLQMIALGQPPAEVSRLIEGTLQGNQALKQAWETYTVWSHNATVQEAIFTRLQFSVSAMSVIITFIAVLDTFCYIWISRSDNLSNGDAVKYNLQQVVSVLRWFVVVLPFILAAIQAMSARLNAGEKWTVLELSAMRVQREIFRFRCGVGHYRRSVNNDGLESPEQTLQQRIHDISEDLHNSACRAVVMEPYDGPKPPPFIGTYGDDGYVNYAALSSRDYVDMRLRLLTDIMERRAKECKRVVAFDVFFIGLFSAAGTAFVVAAGATDPSIVVWVSATTAVVTAVQRHMEYSRVEALHKRFNLAAIELKSALAWWTSLGPHCEMWRNRESLVERCEDIVLDATKYWAQQTAAAAATEREAAKAASAELQKQVEMAVMDATGRPMKGDDAAGGGDGDGGGADGNAVVDRATADGADGLDALGQEQLVYLLTRSSSECVVDRKRYKATKGAAISALTTLRKQLLAAQESGAEGHGVPLRRRKGLGHALRPSMESATAVLDTAEAVSLATRHILGESRSAGESNADLFALFAPPRFPTALLVALRSRTSRRRFLRHLLIRSAPVGSATNALLGLVPSATKSVSSQQHTPLDMSFRTGTHERPATPSMASPLFPIAHAGTRHAVEMSSTSRVGRGGGANEGDGEWPAVIDERTVVASAKAVAPGQIQYAARRSDAVYASFIASAVASSATTSGQNGHKQRSSVNGARHDAIAAKRGLYLTLSIAANELANEIFAVENEEGDRLTFAAVSLYISQHLSEPTAAESRKGKDKRNRGESSDSSVHSWHQGAASASLTPEWHAVDLLTSLVAVACSSDAGGVAGSPAFPPLAADLFINAIPDSQHRAALRHVTRDMADTQSIIYKLQCNCREQLTKKNALWVLVQTMAATIAELDVGNALYEAGSLVEVFQNYASANMQSTAAGGAMDSGRELSRREAAQNAADRETNAKAMFSDMLCALLYVSHRPHIRRGAYHTSAKDDLLNLLPRLSNHAQLGSGTERRRQMQARLAVLPTIVLRELFVACRVVEAALDHLDDVLLWVASFGLLQRGDGTQGLTAGPSPTLGEAPSNRLYQSITRELFVALRESFTLRAAFLRLTLHIDTLVWATSHQCAVAHRRFCDRLHGMTANITHATGPLGLSEASVITGALRALSNHTSPFTFLKFVAAVRCQLAKDYDFVAVDTIGVTLRHLFDLRQIVNDPEHYAAFVARFDDVTAALSSVEQRSDERGGGSYAGGARRGAPPLSGASYSAEPQWGTPDNDRLVPGATAADRNSNTAHSLRSASAPPSAFSSVIGSLGYRYLIDAVHNVPPFHLGELFLVIRRCSRLDEYTVRAFEAIVVARDPSPELKPFFQSDVSPSPPHSHNTERREARHGATSDAAASLFAARQQLRDHVEEWSESLLLRLVWLAHTVDLKVLGFCLRRSDGRGAQAPRGRRRESAAERPFAARGPVIPPIAVEAAASSVVGRSDVFPVAEVIENMDPVIVEVASNLLVPLAPPQVGVIPPWALWIITRALRLSTIDRALASCFDDAIRSRQLSDDTLRDKLYGFRLARRSAPESRVILCLALLKELRRSSSQFLRLASPYDTRRMNEFTAQFVAIDVDRGKLAQTMPFAYGLDSARGNGSSQPSQEKNAGGNELTADEEIASSWTTLFRTVIEPVTTTTLPTVKATSDRHRTEDVMGGGASRSASEGKRAGTQDATEIGEEGGKRDAAAPAKRLLFEFAQRLFFSIALQLPLRLFADIAAAVQHLDVTTIFVSPHERTALVTYLSIAFIAMDVRRHRASVAGGAVTVEPDNMPGGSDLARSADYNRDEVEDIDDDDDDKQSDSRRPSDEKQEGAAPEENSDSGADDSDDDDDDDLPSSGSSDEEAAQSDDDLAAGEHGDEPESATRKASLLPRTVDEALRTTVVRYVLRALKRTLLKHDAGHGTPLTRLLSRLPWRAAKEIIAATYVVLCSHSGRVVLSLVNTMYRVRERMSRMPSEHAADVLQNAFAYGDVEAGIEKMDVVRRCVDHVARHSGDMWEAFATCSRWKKYEGRTRHERRSLWLTAQVPFTPDLLTALCDLPKPCRDSILEPTANRPFAKCVVLDTSTYRQVAFAMLIAAMKSDDPRRDEERRLRLRGRAELGRAE